MQNHHSKSEPVLPGGMTNQQRPDSNDVPVDTAKLQEALEKRADQETAALPPLTLPDSKDSDPAFDAAPEHEINKNAGKLPHKKVRTGSSSDKRLWTPGTRSWFFTFMCMNMPVVGWFYLFYKARHEEDPARKEFARAYLFYKLVFLIAGLIVLLILIWIGLGLLDQLLAYMEML